MGLPLFVPILLSGAAYVTRLMLTEFATEGAVTLLERLSKRKQFLGINGKGVDDFVKTSLEDVNDIVNIKDVTTLDFMLSFFPADIDFDYLTKYDTKRNDWDSIVEPLEAKEETDLELDFICFTGDNSVFENAVANFGAMLLSEEAQPMINKQLEPVKDKIWKVRNALAKRGLKILAHSSGNDLYMILYSPSDIVDFKDDLEVYLDEKRYPFGICFSVIKISSATSNRKTGLVENGFINGNINATMDLIDGVLKVSPPMKGMIDDANRRKIIKDETFNSELKTEYGYVIDSEGGVRLPNVTDYMFIPSAVFDTIDTLFERILSKSKVEKTNAINLTTNYIKRVAIKEFSGHVDGRTMREDMTNYMSSSEVEFFVKDQLSMADIDYTMTGVNNFVKSWKDTYKTFANSGQAHIAPMNNLAIALGFRDYGIQSRSQVDWAVKYVRRMDNSSFPMRPDSGPGLMNFFKGLLKVVSDLEVSNVFLTDDFSKIEMVESYIDNYDMRSSYDLNTKKKVKNKKLAVLRKIIDMLVIAYSNRPDNFRDVDLSEDKAKKTERYNDFGKHVDDDKLADDIMKEYDKSKNVKNVESVLDSVMKAN